MFRSRHYVTYSGRIYCLKSAFESVFQIECWFIWFSQPLIYKLPILNFISY